MATPPGGSFLHTRAASTNDIHNLINAGASTSTGCDTSHPTHDLPIRQTPINRSTASTRPVGSYAAAAGSQFRTRPQGATRTRFVFNSSPSTTDRQANHNLITTKNGIIIEASLFQYSNKDYLTAIKAVTGAKQIYSYSRIQGQFSVYFVHSSFASDLIARGLAMPANHHVPCHPIGTPPVRVVISDVPSHFEPSFIRDIMSSYGRVVGPIKTLRASKVDDDLDPSPDPRFDWCRWWFRTFKPCVRQFARDYWACRHSVDRQECRSLVREITSYATSNDPRFFTARAHLTSILESRARDALLHSRVDYYRNVDAPSASFYRWASGTKPATALQEILLPDGNVVTDPAAVRAGVVQFYSALFRPADHSPSRHPARDTLFLHVPHLSATSSDALTVPYTLTDFHVAMRSLSRNRAPGLDGLPVEFYATFWDTIGPILFQVYRALLTDPRALCYATDFSSSVVCLLPKTGDLRDLRNWRPLSLPDTDYKIFSKCLSLRLGQILPEIISPSQSCAVPTRTIFDNLHVIRDMIDLANASNEPLALVNIDQEKAFDNVSHDYLFSLLRRLGFPACFLTAVQLLYRDSIFQIKVNSTLTTPVTFSQGIRQGCPLSGMLYAIAIDPLLRHLDDAIRRPLATHSYLSLTNCTYADDLTAAIRSDFEFRIFRDCLDTYSCASGARINNRKSVGLWCGSWKGCLDSPLGFQWQSDGCKFLGVFLGNTPSFVARNWPALEAKLSRVLGRWRPLKPSCSVYGRVLIVTQLVASTLWHVFKVVDPPAEFLARCQKLLRDFVWDRVHWVSEDTCLLPKRIGGLDLVSVHLKVRGFRLSLVTSLLLSAEPCRPFLLTFSAFAQVVPQAFFPWLLSRPVLTAPSPFYTRALREWARLRYTFDLSKCSFDSFRLIPIFDTPGITDPEGAPFSQHLHPRFLQYGITTLYDLLDPLTLWWKCDIAVFPTATPLSRYLIRSYSLLRLCIVATFPTIFDNHGVRSTYIFGDHSYPTLLVRLGVPANTLSPLSTVGSSRLLYHVLLTQDATLPSPSFPPSLQVPAHTRFWHLNSISPLSTRLENATHWRLLHSALPVPTRLAHMDPLISHFCPYCPSLGDHSHMYFTCPITESLVTSALDFLHTFVGHTHHPSDYWFLVPDRSHHVCNFSFVLLHDVLYRSHLHRDLIAFPDIPQAVRNLFLTFRGRFLGRISLEEQWARRHATYASFHLTWGITSERLSTFP